MKNFLSLRVKESSFENKPTRELETLQQPRYAQIQFQEIF